MPGRSLREKLHEVPPLHYFQPQAVAAENAKPATKTTKNSENGRKSEMQENATREAK